MIVPAARMAEAFDDPQEKPLDPAVERVQRRLRRLMLISGLTLGLGIFAVFAAIIYRLFTYAPAAPPPPVAVAAGAAVPTLKRSDLGIPVGATLVSTALDASRLSLTFADGGDTVVIVLDLPSLTVVNRFVIRD